MALSETGSTTQEKDRTENLPENDPENLKALIAASERKIEAGDDPNGLLGEYIEKIGRRAEKATE